MTGLASDLVFEIFARVSIKDLLRFRCVCKSWRSLFQDESFIRRHATRAPSMYLVVPWRLDRHTPYTCTYESLRLISQEPDLNNDEVKSLLLRACVVISHCDGLFCLGFPDNSLAVWNPALRELRRLPRTNQLQTWSMMGFGYDHSTQNHKIVLMQLGNCSRAQVLTLKSSVSRMIDFPWRKKCELIRVIREGILVGENIFWLLHARQSTIENGENILTFSVVSETFNYCSGPSETQVYQALKVLRGSLCAVERERGDYCNDMVFWCAEHEKEDKSRIKSWSKILRLTASDIFRPTRWLVDEFRLGAVINQAGLLLIIVRKREGGIKLCQYSLEENTVRTVETTNLGYFDNLQEYIATLVPTRAYQVS